MKKPFSEPNPDNEEKCFIELYPAASTSWLSKISTLSIEDYEKKVSRLGVKICDLTKSFSVPDETAASTLLNSKDRECSLPFNLLDGVSLRAGVFEPQSQSKIFIIPHTTQPKGSHEYYT